MEPRGRKQFYDPYVWTIVMAGGLVLVDAVRLLCVQQVGAPFWLLLLATVLIASHITVKFFRFDSHISISDIFIFLALLLLGREAAVVIGAAESLYSSVRITKKPLTMAFNAAAMACSTFITASISTALFGPLTQLAGDEYSARLIAATCVMGTVQYFVNSLLVATAASFWTDKPVLATWRKHYVWASITYLAGASAAAITFKLIGMIGFYAFIAMMPIVAIIYFTYLTYVKNIQASTAQAESEKRFHQAFDQAPIGMALVSPDGRWLQVNHSLCTLIGYTERELLQKNYRAITLPEDLPKMTATISEVARTQTAISQVEVRYLHKLGHQVCALIGISPLVGPDEEAAPQLIFQIQDITDRKRAEAQLIHDAYHDALTGLPNRSWFIEQLGQALGAARNNPQAGFAVLFLDLDRFKIINDSMGHLFGDQLLINTAERLQASVRPGDKIARLGGDEFTVLMSGLTERAEVIRNVERIQQEVSQPFVLNGFETFTTASIGIALSELGYDKPEELLRDADTAMYQAKSLGKAQHVIFDKRMHLRALNLLQLESDLRRAIDRGEFRVQYQPIISLKSGTLSGFEALVRWHHPERGMISPDEFISVAEETGIIVPLGKWVLAESCAQLREWEARFDADLPLLMSVNLSSKQFMDASLLEQILQIVTETRIDPRKLKLEITESVVMENIEVASQMLNQLRDIGVGLSIDDFGTGYSSLSYLHRLPINTLKIDRSFVSRMNEQNENYEIVRTIVLLAQNLGLGIIAEGVETIEQVARLAELKCDHGQGFFFSKPVDADEATLLVEKMTRAEPINIEVDELIGGHLDVALVNTYPM
ncbi:MAG TPA: EAL domain-containing protein [Blastocatellia bacterium]|nr:EAL domain-containing protein [Blastocatellia bacterium]